MILAYALLLGSFLQGDDHLYLANRTDAETDASSFWFWLILGIILLGILIVAICFDGNGHPRRWLTRNNYQSPRDEDH